jgi:hypothetical protein
LDHSVSPIIFEAPPGFRVYVKSEVIDMPSSFCRIVGLLALITTFTTGCMATVSSRPAYAVYDDYPHTYYDGETVYYFDGYWHRRHGSSWVVAFREEPRALYQYRSRRNAPPARRDYDRSHRREPAERRYRDHDHDRGRRSAPPAERYR